jgi:hypothetical protein
MSNTHLVTKLDELIPQLKKIIKFILNYYTLNTPTKEQYLQYDNQCHAFYLMLDQYANNLRNLTNANSISKYMITLRRLMHDETLGDLLDMYDVE